MRRRHTEPLRHRRMRRRHLPFQGRQSGLVRNDKSGRPLAARSVFHMSVFSVAGRSPGGRSYGETRATKGRPYGDGDARATKGRSYGVILSASEGSRPRCMLGNGEILRRWRSSE